MYPGFVVTVFKIPIEYYALFRADIESVSVVLFVRKIYIILPLWTFIYYNPSESTDVLKGISGKFDIPFIDLYNKEYFNQHPELFKDSGHLNDKGANIYTKMIFEEIKRYIK